MYIFKKEKKRSGQMCLCPSPFFFTSNQTLPSSQKTKQRQTPIKWIHSTRHLKKMKQKEGPTKDIYNNRCSSVLPVS